MRRSSDSASEQQQQQQQQPFASYSRGDNRHLSRPVAVYSPMGADSGYGTDSPFTAGGRSGEDEASLELAFISSLSFRRSSWRGPPPGTFRPVSPQQQQQQQQHHNSGAAASRHAATQTPPLLQQQHQQQPLLQPQHSMGFRPASAPLHDLPDTGEGEGQGEEEEDIDEEVFLSYANRPGRRAPLPDLLRFQQLSEEPDELGDAAGAEAAAAARQRSRSVPICSDAQLHERVARELRDIGDMFNHVRVSPMPLSQHRYSRRRRSLRSPSFSTVAGSSDWLAGSRDSLYSLFSRLVRTVSGASIDAQEQRQDRP